MNTPAMLRTFCDAVEQRNGDHDGFCAMKSRVGTWMSDTIPVVIVRESGRSSTP